MSVQVVIVGGKMVYSEKKVVGITGTNVTFNDGSWCDVVTGQVVNKGPGRISLETPGDVPNETERLKVFRAHRLHISEVMANILIQPLTIEQIFVRVRPESFLNDLTIEQQGNVVVIKSVTPPDDRDLTVIFSSDRASTGRCPVIISNQNLTIVDDKIISGKAMFFDGKGPKMSIEVLLPVNSTLNITDVLGTVDIGDVRGSLFLSVHGACYVRTGEMGDIRINVSGSGIVEIAKVFGDAKLQVTGSGRISVTRGDIGELEAEVTGSGFVNVYGVANEADLEVTGSGKIYVAQVTKPPRKHVSGSGSIIVGNWADR